MKIMQIQTPIIFEPKKGGMIDAIRQDKFVDFLTDVWPENKRKRDEQIKQDEDNSNWYYNNEI